MKSKIAGIEASIDAEVARVFPIGSDASVIASLQTEKETTLALLRTKLRDAQADFDTAREQQLPSLETLHVQKTTASVLVSIVLSLLVAMAGVRVISQFLPMIANTQAVDYSLGGGLDGAQMNLLVGVDVALTALLLAGGAEAIHTLMKRFLLMEKDLLA